jgi:hypothetical protein
MNATKTLTLTRLAAVGVCVLMLACGQKPATSQKAAIAGQQEELVALEAKRQARMKELKGMDVPRLVEQLSADSTRGVEPFNSMAYREIVSRGASAAAPLKAALSAPSTSSLLALLALRRISPADYKGLEPALRSQILLGSLRTSKFFNSWGLPHVAWEEAGKALIEEGRGVESALVGLLDDKREARVWGSEGATEALKYRYRVCDYAWALLNEIRGKPVPIPEDPAERDKLIEAAKH